MKKKLTKSERIKLKDIGQKIAIQGLIIRNGVKILNSNTSYTGRKNLQKQVEGAIIKVIKLNNRAQKIMYPKNEILKVDVQFKEYLKWHPEVVQALGKDPKVKAKDNNHNLTLLMNTLKRQKI